MSNLSENALILKTMLQKYNDRQKELKTLFEDDFYNDMEHSSAFHNVSELSKRVIDRVNYNYRVEYIQKANWLFIINIIYDYRKHYIKIDEGSFVTDILRGELLNLEGLDSDNFTISVYNFYQWIKKKFRHEPKYIEIVDKHLVGPLAKELLEAGEIKVTTSKDGHAARIELLK
jgi:hypothetical protein